MRFTIPTLLALSAVACPAPTQAQAPDLRREQRTLRFAPGAARLVDIDTVWGAIDVIGYDGATVDVTITRTTRASTDEARAEAERDVHLRVEDQTPTVRLFVDGPFRCREADGDLCEHRGWRRPEYEVAYDFTVRVPRDVSLRLRTVDRGRITVRGVEGGFDVRNVNGPIDLEEVATGGTAKTVNGDVRATFRRNPRDPVRLKTVNGDVVARFVGALGADAWISTVHGDVWTDYDYTPLPPRAPEAQQRGTTRVWRIGRKNGVRIGAGGPALELDTFHGSISILRSQS